MMKKIEEIIQISKGKKPKLISKVLEKGLMPYVDIKAFEQKIIDNYTDGEKCLPCEDGDLLIVCDGSRSGLVGKAVKGYVGSTLARIDIDKSVLPEYIYHFIQGKYIQLNTSIKGTGTPHLNQELLKSFELYVPPLEDQHRIVTRIEELFSQLDSGVETLKKTKEQLKVYRQAVLNELICEGELSELRYCIDDMGQGWSPKCIRTPVLNNDEWAVITTTSIQPMKFIYSENKKLPDSLEPRMKHVIEVGDILITRAGPRVRCGVCCMVRQTKSKLLNCDKVYRIKVNKRLIIPEYLEIVLNSPEFQKEVSFCKTGGNDSGVNLTQERFLSIKIPVPTINKQKEK